MDPNKIHIDELVRQRLQGSEEEPRPGAWITMRELLDKQLPTGRPLGGLGWGTATRWTIGLVLLTLLAGGYGAMDIRRQSAAAFQSAPFASNAGGVNRIAAASTRNTTSEDNNGSGPAQTVQAPHLSGNRSGSSAAASAESRAEFSARVNENSSNSPSRAVGQSSPATTAATPTGAGLENALLASSSSASSRQRHRSSRGATARVQQPTASGPSTSNLKSVDNSNTVTASTTPAQSTEPKQVAPRAQRNARRSTSAISRSPQTAGNNVFASTATANTSRTARNSRASRNGDRPVRALDSTKTMVQRDTVRPIRIAHRYLSAPGTRAGRYVADTLAYEPIIVEKPMPVASTQSTTQGAVAGTRQRRKLFARKQSSTQSTPEAIVSASPAKPSVVAAAPVPASAPPASASLSSVPAANAQEDLVPLSSYKVSSHKSTSLQYSAHEQLQDAMRRARFAFAQMRLYTGVTGGFNASVGGTSLGGFQAGMFALLAINEKWSVGMEGKFVQRFNRGTELHDPYFQYRASTFNRIEKNGEAYNIYRVTTDSFEHYYKLSTIETIELPLYARYTHRRFHGFAGVNLTYGLRINNMERVDRFAGRESQQMDTVLSTVAYAPPANTAATVGLNDFGSRFGIGYAAGVGYQATPSVLVDVRMTQLLWDNRSAGAGGLRVSQTFYRVPSLQLSIGYRFSQRMSRR